MLVDLSATKLFVIIDITCNSLYISKLFFENPNDLESIIFPNSPANSCFPPDMEGIPFFKQYAGHSFWTSEPFP